MARMATADADGAPHAVPICYAFDGSHLYSVIDLKPKRVAAQGLKRVRNILANPRVAIVIDDYDEEWERLAYVLIHGPAEVLEEGEEQRRAVTLLREKYQQYRDMDIEGATVIKVTVERVIPWGKV